jgi:hypothetical protein
LSAGSPPKNQISGQPARRPEGQLLDLSWLVHTHDKACFGFNRNGGVYEQYRRSTALPRRFGRVRLLKHPAQAVNGWFL